ncbi:MAG: hypothetical protein V4507_11490 [Verrucomicrobiota bacterium]
MINENKTLPVAPYIPVDEKSYLSQEADGRYFLWDQTDFPHARILSYVPHYQAEMLIRGGDYAHRLLRKIYWEYKDEIFHSSAMA